MKTKHLLFTIFCLMVSIFTYATEKNSRSTGAETYDYEIDLANIKTNAESVKDGYVVSNGGTGDMIFISQANKNYRIYGTTTTYGIFTSNNVVLTLDNANITTASGFAVIEMNSDLNLTLKGTNSLSGSTTLGIMSSNYNLTIGGDGSVKVEYILGIKKFTLNGGTIISFGIGAENININGGTIDGGHLRADNSVNISDGIINVKGEGQSNGIEAQDTVIITGGIVNAESASYTNGIWGVDGVEISGGVVRATSLQGYGISSVYNGVVISGGSVYASGYMTGANSDPQPINKKSETVYMTTLGGMPANTAITNLTAPSGYGINGLKTDADGLIYLWLPEGNQVITYTVGSMTVNKTFTIAPHNYNAFAVGDVVVSVSDATELKTALERTIPSTINITTDITFDMLITAGTSHVLNIPNGKAVTASGSGRININTGTLTIKGGGTFFAQRSSGYVLFSNTDATLNLENITIKLQNQYGNGISVKTFNIGNAATVILDSESGRDLISIGKDYTCTVNTGGKIEILNFWDDGINMDGGTLHINGGTVITGEGQAGKRSIYLVSGSTLKYTTGTLNGVEGSLIYLSEGSILDGLNGRFKDQGLILRAIQVTVGTVDAEISIDGLTRGIYYWDGSLFAKEAIIINDQPKNLTVTEGKISASLSISGSASNNEELSYQWWETNEGGWFSSSITDAINSTFSIPTDLSEGIYYYYCIIKANKCMEVQSNTVIVTVKAPGSNSIEESEGFTAPIVYPTITSNFVQIKGLLNEAVYIYNLSGDLILETMAETIDLSTYPQGIYLFKIGRTTTKVVKRN
ncbi:MAG: pectate lyase-like adhesive domain-containing protein [Dysgonomonas sp.]